MFELLSLLKSPKGLLLLLSLVLVNVYFGVVDSITTVPDANLKLVYQSNPKEEAVFFQWVALINNTHVSIQEQQLIHQALQNAPESKPPNLLTGLLTRNSKVLQSLPILLQNQTFSIPYTHHSSNPKTVRQNLVATFSIPYAYNDTYHGSNPNYQDVALKSWLALLELELLQARGLAKAHKPDGLSKLLTLFKAAKFTENNNNIPSVAVDVEMRNTLLKELTQWKKTGWLTLQQKQQLQRSKTLLMFTEGAAVNAYKAEYTFLEQTLKDYKELPLPPYLYQPNATKCKLATYSSEQINALTSTDKPKYETAQNELTFYDYLLPNLIGTLMFKITLPKHPLHLEEPIRRYNQEMLTFLDKL